MSEKIRLAKLMSHKNICSRREAEALIAAGQVTVNDVVWTNPAEKVNESDNIVVLNEGQDQLDQKLTILLHKPLGFVSGQEEDDHRPAVQLITKEHKDPQFKFKLDFHKNLRLAPAGRLDIDSTGLLVFTENGVLAKKLIGENTEVEKEYKVKVDGEITDRSLELLRHGLKLDGKALKPAEISVLDDQILRMVLKEGKKRQIRRMCELVDLKVVSLKRTRIGQIKLGTLEYGKWRFLEPEELF